LNYFKQRHPGETVKLTEHSTGHLVPLVAGKAQAFVPGPPLARLVWNNALVGMLSQADQALALLAGVGRRLASPQLISGAFGRKEAVFSSRIEGTQSTLSELFLYEAEPSDTPATADVREVLNYVNALRLGLALLDKLPVSSRLIREIHKELMADVRGQHRAPGTFRRSQNWIGPAGCTIEEATYVPPPPQEMQQSLGELEQYINRPPELPLLIRLAAIHYQFEAIHPFLDGNGRIGRLLIPLILCAEGLLTEPLLYLSAYFERTRQEYYARLLQVSIEGAWHEWLLYFLDAVNQQAHDAINRCEKLLDLHEEYRGLVAQAGAPATFMAVVDRLFESPYISVRQAEKLTGNTYPTVKKYITVLAERGALISGPRRALGQLYVAERILRAIDD
jgi:Fic family protein